MCFNYVKKETIPTLKRQEDGSDMHVLQSDRLLNLILKQ